MHQEEKWFPCKPSNHFLLAKWKTRLKYSVSLNSKHIEYMCGMYRYHFDTLDFNFDS